MANQKIVAIPSKNIYEKTLQLANNNIIEKVEVTANVPQKNINHNAYYDLNLPPKWIEEESIETPISVSEDFTNLWFPGKFFGAMAGIRGVFMPCHITSDAVLEIPYFDTINRRKLSINYKDGNITKDSVKVLSNGTLKKGLANCYIYKGSAISQLEFRMAEGVGELTAETVSYEVQDKKLVSETSYFVHTDTDSKQFNASAVMQLKQTNGNLSNDIEKQCYKIENLQLALQWDMYSFAYGQVAAFEYGKQHRIIGTREIFTPEAITISLLCTEETVGYVAKSITAGNKDGNAFTLNSNDLMQSEEGCEALAKSVYNYYSAGKEVLTLKCGINDYFERYEKVTETITRNNPNLSFDESTKNYIYTLPEGTKIFDYSNTFNGIISVVIDVLRVFSVTVENNRFILSNDKQKNDTLKSLTLEYTIETNPNASEPIELLNLHDIVLPLADNENTPISINRKGKPKLFEVIGRKMIYDGAVYQELTLQEYK